jgi:hypothetical protein
MPIKSLSIVMRLLVASTLLLAGCASGYAPAYRPSQGLEFPSGPGTLPPSFYGNDPSLEKWFDPYIPPSTG